MDGAQRRARLSTNRHGHSRHSPAAVGAELAEDGAQDISHSMERCTFHTDAPAAPEHPHITASSREASTLGNLISKPAVSTPKNSLITQK